MLVVPLLKCNINGQFLQLIRKLAVHPVTNTQLVTLHLSNLKFNLMVQESIMYNYKRSFRLQWSVVQQVQLLKLFLLVLHPPFRLLLRQVLFVKIRQLVFQPMLMRAMVRLQITHGLFHRFWVQPHRVQLPALSVNLQHFRQTQHLGITEQVRFNLLHPIIVERRQLHITLQ